MPSDLFWASFPPGTRERWTQEAAALGMTLDQYISQGTQRSSFGSDLARAAGSHVNTYQGRQNLLLAAAIAGGGIAASGAAGGAGAGAAGGVGGAAGSGFPAGYAGAGPWMSSAGAASGGGFLSTFGGQALLNAGLNLTGGFLQDRATKKANQANQKAIQDRIKQALQQLSPEQIQVLVRQFLPNIAAVNNPLQQTSLQGLATSQARQGLAGTPYGLTAEAGLRGQLANATSTQAFQQAMGLAGQRAGAITGMPFAQQQPQTGFADAFGQTANQIMLARALSQRPPNPQAQQLSGTPWNWGFNTGGRY